MVDREQDLGKAAKEKFETLRDRWKDATIMLSDSREIIEDPNYIAIIDMGEEALPFIFEELQENPDWWFHALGEITGENPAQVDNAGDLRRLTNRWLAWGREHGYLDEENSP